MEKTKLRYEAPEAETFVVRFEGMVCASPLYGSKGKAGATLQYNDYEDEDF